MNGAIHRLWRFVRDHERTCAHRLPSGDCVITTDIVPRLDHTVGTLAVVRVDCMGCGAKIEEKVRP